MRKLSLLLIAVAGLVAVPALAQTPPQGTPIRIRGTVEKFADHTLTVKSPDGQSRSIILADNVFVAYLVKKSMTDIKSGDFLASTGIRGSDGNIHAIEVRIFPEALRGAGEGQYPWDLKPDSIMTNATAGQITSSPDGNVVKVTYKGTESEYTIDPTTPIFAYEQGDTSLLVSGAAVFVIAVKKDDGTLTAARVTVEKNGIKPPM
jgi:hypothetical protein